MSEREQDSSDSNAEPSPEPVEHPLQGDATEITQKSLDSAKSDG